MLWSVMCIIMVSGSSDELVKSRSILGNNIVMFGMNLILWLKSQSLHRT